MMKKIYMLLMLLFSRGLEVFSKRDKIVFLSSFGDNNVPVANELIQRNPTASIVFLYERSAGQSLLNLDPRIVRKKCDGVAMFSCIPTLVSARKLVIDNYFAVLGALPKNKKSETIQVWHANGAIKQFGYEDASNRIRPLADKKRFKKVYDFTDSYVVGSKKMQAIFEQSFEARGKKFLPFGIARTDVFFDNKLMTQKRLEIRRKFDVSESKKVIVYAPTYRSGELSNELQLDVELLRREHSEDSVLLIKRHPRLNDSDLLTDDDFIKIVPNTTALTDFYPAIDVLISDFSSIPFEISLLPTVKKMLFFCYDEKEYELQQGLQQTWRTMLPGPIIATSQLLSEELKNVPYKADYEGYNKTWNTYTTGNAVKQLADYLQ